MHTITLTRANIANAENNQMIYEVPGSKALEGSEIALSSLYMYYAWENINASPLNNNVFVLQIPELIDGATPPTTKLAQEITITIPDGIYEVPDVNAYLQQFCIENNMYLLTDGGEYIYFVQVQANVPKYKLQFNSFTLPTSTFVFGSAHTNGITYNKPTSGFFNSTILQTAGGTDFFPTGNIAIGWRFPDGFSEWAGFAANEKSQANGTVSTVAGAGPTGIISTNGVNLTAFPVGSASFLSTKTPQVNPNPVIYLNCDKISNTFSRFQTFLHPIPAKTSVAQLINIEVPEFSWHSLQTGDVSRFSFFFTDAEGRPIKLLDPNIIVTCVIKDPSHLTHQGNMGASGPGGISKSMETLRQGQHPMYGSHRSAHSNNMRSLR